MDREIVIYVLLLVALTWLLYKLTVMMEPPGDKPAGGKPQHDVNTDASVLGVSRSRQKPIHQRCASEHHELDRPDIGRRVGRVPGRGVVVSGEIRMNMLGVMQIVIFAIVLTALVKPLGNYMAKVYLGERTCCHPSSLQWSASSIACVGSTRMRIVMEALRGGIAAVNFIGFVFVYLLQRLQGVLPLNPQEFPGVGAESAFNTAVSFASNTNWQGLWRRIHDELLDSDARIGRAEFRFRCVGHGGAGCLIRGFARRQAQQVGNFYVDMTRGTLYILLPLSVLLALVLISQGVVQNFSAYQTVDLVEPVTIQSAVKDAAGQPVVDAAGNAVTQAEQITQQTIPLGPAASQVAIKQLGTNGGGFFNVNSAHPLENPTPLTNFLEVLAILLIPAALCYTFGRMVKDTRQGWAVYAGDDDHLPAADLRCLRRRAVGQSAFGNIGRRSGQLAATRRRQHGRQGSALRHRQLGVVGCGHDGCIERIGQLDA